MFASPKLSLWSVSLLGYSSSIAHCSVSSSTLTDVVGRFAAGSSACGRLCVGSSAPPAVVLFWLSSTQLSVFPYVLCQDAQGGTKSHAGGAGLCFGRPPAAEVVNAALSTHPGGRSRVFGTLSADEGSLRIDELPQLAPCGEKWKDLKWHDVLVVDWTFHDAIHLGETRAVLLWLENLCRLDDVSNTRVLNLSDSQSAVGALTKGRSRSFSLN